MLYYVCLALEWPVRLLLYLLLKNRSIMIQDELRALYDQMSDEEKNENSVLKGRFTKYITRRLEWHAIRYAAKNRPNVIVISLDQAPRHLTDIDAEQMFRKVEIELALQQEVQRLSPKEKEWLLCFLKMNYKEIQKHFGCGHTYVYEKRKKLAETMKALKE